MKNTVKKIKELIELRDNGDLSAQKKIDSLISKLENSTASQKAKSENSWINSQSLAMQG